ncbi:MAG TPA: efflux RND transporter periplasmic adaptor subunit [Alphaproteobacteria bacterium]|nr:efflux RND transporter periplasmic adaptor subunit [Alphaproteobacteria bacterium]HNS44260.1 efflux RND transporter periplasmic adaptor subunit [Alphaproteobacteria bacterium]
MIDKLASSWKFHFILRLLALAVISVSTYALLTKGDSPSAPAQDVTAEMKAEDTPPAAHLTLSEIKSRQQEKAEDLADMKPANGNVGLTEYPVEEDSITVDGVLVPKKETVISSSSDGKISNIPLENGDHFKKNDVLVRYDCADLEAEAEMIGMQKQLTETKSKNVAQLFKLDIISDIDRLGAQTEDKQLAAKIKMYEARLNDCIIRAEFDGVVTKRLANEGEYTRTDRVLMEVASGDPLNIEFLLPSKWLRWINVGAPITIDINETGRTYNAKIIRIYGAVDPVSQSIQIRAALDSYQDLLLSGMSGKVTIDVPAVKKEGIIGYLSAHSGP